MIEVIPAESLLEEGLRYRDEGLLRRAVRSWWMYTAESPRLELQYSALILIARALLELNDYDPAIRTSERAAAIYPRLSEPFFIVASAYEKFGIPRAAMKVLIDGFRRELPPSDWPLEIDINEFDLYPRRLYGRLLVQVGWGQEAMQVAYEGLRDFPEDPVFSETMKEAAVVDARDQGYHL